MDSQPKNFQEILESQRREQEKKVEEEPMLVKQVLEDIRQAFEQNSYYIQIQNILNDPLLNSLCQGIWDHWKEPQPYQGFTISSPLQRMKHATISDIGNWAALSPEAEVYQQERDKFVKDLYGEGFAVFLQGLARTLNFQVHYTGVHKYGSNKFDLERLDYWGTSQWLWKNQCMILVRVPRYFSNDGVHISLVIAEPEFHTLKEGMSSRSVRSDSPSFGIYIWHRLRPEAKQSIEGDRQSLVQFAEYVASKMISSDNPLLFSSSPDIETLHV